MIGKHKLLGSSDETQSILIYLDSHVLRRLSDRLMRAAKNGDISSCTQAIREYADMDTQDEVRFCFDGSSCT